MKEKLKVKYYFDKFGILRIRKVDVEDFAGFREKPEGADEKCEKCEG